jgi:hypothetical protein
MFKLITIGSLALICLVFPSAVNAAEPSSGLTWVSDFGRDHDGEKHPKKLELAFAVTRKLTGGESVRVPLHFGLEYSNSGDPRVEDPALGTVGKVKLSVTVLRGDDVLSVAEFDKKPTVAEASDGVYLSHLFCDPFDGEPLLAGDLVVVTFKFRKRDLSSLGRQGGPSIIAMVGPPEIFEAAYINPYVGMFGMFNIDDCS